MNYIGSKYSLIHFLEKVILRKIDSSCRVLFDVFAGTGTVGWHFKQRGFRIVANDIQYYAYCLNQARVGVNRTLEFSGILKELKVTQKALFNDASDVVLKYLNGLKGKSGFIYQNYCPIRTTNLDFKRQYFSNENGKRCDVVRMQIEAWREAGKLTEDEYFYLLASLIEAADKVANTASVYGAFLKHIKKSAMKPLRLEQLPIVESDVKHKIFNCEGSLLVEDTPCDILYMDPPYNHRQYCANYHVLETIARYDNPVLRGVTGLRPYDRQKSDFCSKKRALPAFEKMVQKTQARYIFLSYNSEGIMHKDEILSTMAKYGEVELLTKDYSRFRADIDRENRVYKADCVEEYLFCLEKR